MCREKEREQEELENRSSAASKALQAAQTNLSSLRAQMKAKRDEIKSENLSSGLYINSDPQAQTSTNVYRPAWMENTKVLTPLSRKPLRKSVCGMSAYERESCATNFNLGRIQRAWEECWYARCLQALP